jgi:putative toxin-antitoxin system antitoxin component (TIGR02293 family)
MPKLTESINPIFLKAEKIFGSQKKAAIWFEKPNPNLNGNTPLKLLSSKSGTEQVTDILTRIEHGVYS